MKANPSLCVRASVRVCVCVQALAQRACCVSPQCSPLERQSHLSVTTHIQEAQPGAKRGCVCVYVCACTHACVCQKCEWVCKLKRMEEGKKEP